MTNDTVRLPLSHKEAELIIEALSENHGRWMGECERAIEVGDRDTEAAYSEKAAEAWQLVTEIRELLSAEDPESFVTQTLRSSGS